MTMKQTLLVERVMDQTRLAIIEDDRLCELYHERRGSSDVTGNIFLGRVENVLPGMNAAFVNIGMEKNGFLAADDIRPEFRADRELQKAVARAPIEKLVRPGMQLMLQVIKAQSGEKGPRLSGNIMLTGRLMVLLPGVRYVGVSRKLTDETERSRLRAIGWTLMGERGDGLILRTAAQSVPEADLCGEYARLCAQWQELKTQAEYARAPKLLHDENSLLLKAVRDRLSERTETIWTDDVRSYEQLHALAKRIAPQLEERIRLHEGQVPLFDLYRVDTQAEKALQKYVWLKGGGSLVIEETEALTAVDVNSGKNSGKRDVEDTILQNNLEAARELMLQLRLRDIGGTIVADFINMSSQAHRQALLDELRQLAAQDANRTVVVDITPLGLVELTRKRSRQSLGRQLMHSCSNCGGNGVVLSYEVIARRVIRDIWRRRRSGDTSPMLCEAASEVCDWMKTIGAPEGGAVYTRPDGALGAGEYRLMSADITALPTGSRLLK